MQVDLTNKELLLVPLHINESHWALVAVDFLTKRMLYYDSMGCGSGKKYFNAIMCYLTAEFKSAGQPLDFTTWTEKPNGMPGIPLQLNAYDCGVFLCRVSQHKRNNLRV